MTVAELIQILRALPQHLPVVAYDDGMFSQYPHVEVCDLQVDNTSYYPQQSTAFIYGFGSVRMTCAGLVVRLSELHATLPVRIKDDVAYYEPEPEVVPAGGDYRGTPFDQDTLVI
ncbi:MAG: hypothetical protein EOP94_00800 [Zymomonas sp.]|nr:MAG: hypothetical protein EOP94_00800 [Zymomonas sp.]